MPPFFHPYLVFTFSHLLYVLLYLLLSYRSVSVSLCFSFSLYMSLSLYLSLFFPISFGLSLFLSISLSLYFSLCLYVLFSISLFLSLSPLFLFSLSPFSYFVLHTHNFNRSVSFLSRNIQPRSIIIKSHVITENGKYRFYTIYENMMETEADIQTNKWTDSLI